MHKASTKKQSKTAKKVPKKKAPSATKKATATDKKKASDKKSTLQKEQAAIINFVAAISSKKYALANKYLQVVIESKLQTRIASCLSEPLF